MSHTITLFARKTVAEATDAVRAAGAPLAVVDDHGRPVGVVGDAEVRHAAMVQSSPGNGVGTIMSTRFTTVSDDVEVPSVFVADDAAHDHDQDGDHGHDYAVVVDAAGRPIDVLLPVIDATPDTAILMVGGEGTRLMPLTRKMPKPLLPIAGRPILEHIVEHLAGHGVRRIVMTLGYLADRIRDHFGDGANWNATIDYVKEERPLGTAGAIGLIDVEALGDRPLLVMNGDILTGIDIEAMARFHRRSAAAVTMAARSYQHPVPYGVLRLVGQRLVALEEKPVAQWWTNAGIYLVQPDVARSIPGTEYLDMTVLLDRLVREGSPVMTFPVTEYWCDIGQPEDYSRANEDWPPAE